MWLPLQSPACLGDLEVCANRPTVAEVWMRPALWLVIPSLAERDDEARVIHAAELLPAPSAVRRKDASASSNAGV